MYFLTSHDHQGVQSALSQNRFLTGAARYDEIFIGQTVGSKWKTPLRMTIRHPQFNSHHITHSMIDFAHDWPAFSFST